MADDTTVYDVAAWVLECARAALAATTGGAPVHRYVSIGRPTHDNCCEDEGQLTVAVMRQWVSSEFPVPDTDPTPCGGRYLAAQIEVEIIRCVPGPGDNGASPAASVLNASAREMHVDGRAVWLGLRCCLMDRITNWQQLGFPAGFEGYVDNQVPVGPEGGCGGSRTTIVVGIPDGCACD